ncbi:MAG: primase C-terminal domain-containing protein [Proteobacteria bacterium]|nr:primase C-terminal domain-containing protein [Pseudomonadota bacterium]
MTADAERFLRALGGRFTFQTFDDDKTRRKGRDPLAKWMHGTLTDYADTLARLNARGAGVFVMVNEGDGKGRAAANVQRVRALFVDLDGAPLQPVQAAALPAHCIIETSPHRWHAYWCVSDCTLEQFKPLQQALAARFDGDASICDLARVMRLPGFEHRKREPFTSRIVTIDEHRAPYTVAELMRAFDLRAATPQPKAKRRALPDVIREGERNATLLSLAAGLVRKGDNAQAVNDRLQRLNAERCTTPLCATEVDTIVARAVAYGSDGFSILPHKLLDAPELKALPPTAQCIIVAAFRRYDGSNNGNIALPWSDFNDREGCRNEGTFYKHRTVAVDSGILIETRKGTHTQQGITPNLYAIAERFLPVRNPQNSQLAQPIKSGSPLVDKQLVPNKQQKGRAGRKRNEQPKAA